MDWNFVEHQPFSNFVLIINFDSVSVDLIYSNFLDSIMIIVVKGLIVVSSQHADPMNAFATMSSQQIEQQSEHHGHFKWFSSTVFKYHLLLHDVSGGEESK